MTIVSLDPDVGEYDDGDVLIEDGEIEDDDLLSLALGLRGPDFCVDETALADLELARESGVSIPEIAVPAATALLFVANLGILFWRYPRAASIGLIVFFLGTTPFIHDFWTMGARSEPTTRSTSVRTSRCWAVQ